MPESTLQWHKVCFFASLLLFAVVTQAGECTRENALIAAQQRDAFLSWMDNSSPEEIMRILMKNRQMASLFREYAVTTEGAGIITRQSMDYSKPSGNNPESLKTPQMRPPSRTLLDDLQAFFAGENDSLVPALPYLAPETLMSYVPSEFMLPVSPEYSDVFFNGSTLFAAFYADGKMYTWNSSAFLPALSYSLTGTTVGEEILDVPSINGMRIVPDETGASIIWSGYYQDEFGVFLSSDQDVEKISNSTSLAEDAQARMDDLGNLHCTWIEFFASNPYVAYRMRATNGTWSNVIRVSQSQYRAHSVDMALNSTHLILLYAQEAAQRTAINVSVRDLGDSPSTWVEHEWIHEIDNTVYELDDYGDYVLEGHVTETVPTVRCDEASLYPLSNSSLSVSLDTVSFEENHMRAFRSWNLTAPLFSFVYNTPDTLAEAYLTIANGTFPVLAAQRTLIQLPPSTSDCSYHVFPDDVNASIGVAIHDEWISVFQTGEDQDEDMLLDTIETRLGTNPLNTDTDDDGLTDALELMLGLDPLNESDCEVDTDGDGLNNGIEITIGTDILLNDTDNDGLTDYEEFVELGTNPLSDDTDDDTMPDFYEVSNGLDPTTDDRYEDLDEDGLQNGLEHACGTDPTLNDSDGDTMPDGFEYDNYLDPLNENDTTDDPDNDGVSNIEEWEFGTSPSRADSDSDGMDDGWELKFGLDPTNNGGIDGNSGDFDADGLPNGIEYLVGTFPNCTDTDDDGLSDNYEYSHQLDPTIADALNDSDADGLSNYSEYLLETDPTLNDTDADGMADGWEYNYGLDPLSVDNSTDLDDDGLTNIEEFNLGTDPTNADTDGDGLTDSWEVQYEFDPLLPGEQDGDPDEDSLTNIYEFEIGTNPRSSDTDSDNYPDDVEIQEGTDPLDPLDRPFNIGSSSNSSDSPFFFPLTVLILTSIGCVNLIRKKRPACSSARSAEQ